MSLATAWPRGIWLGRALLLLMASLFGLGLRLWADGTNESAPGHVTSATATVVSVHSGPPSPTSGASLHMARLRLPDGREDTVAERSNCAPQADEAISISLAQGARTEMRAHWSGHCALP